MSASCWIRWHAAQGLMRMRAIGLSATLTAWAPALARVSAAATSRAADADRGGAISTTKACWPSLRAWANVLVAVGIGGSILNPRAAFFAGADSVTLNDGGRDRTLARASPIASMCSGP